MFSDLFKSQTTIVASREAFEAKMRASYKQAYSLAYRLTNNATEAEDLVQETYVRSFRFFHRYDSNLPFTSWLYRIMTNVHIDGVRKKGRIRTVSLDTSSSENANQWEIPDESSSPDKAMQEQSMNEPIQLALRSMTPDFRSAVIMADVEGMAYEEIADIMDISIGTVRSRIHRGRKQLRSQLERTCPHLLQGEEE